MSIGSTDPPTNRNLDVLLTAIQSALGGAPVRYHHPQSYQPRVGTAVHEVRIRDSEPMRLDGSWFQNYAQVDATITRYPAFWSIRFFAS